MCKRGKKYILQFFHAIKERLLPDKSNITIICTFVMIRAHLSVIPHSHLDMYSCTRSSCHWLKCENIILYIYDCICSIKHICIYIGICVDERKRASSHLVELADDGEILAYIFRHIQIYAHIQTWVHIYYILFVFCFYFFLNLVNLIKDLLCKYIVRCLESQMLFNVDPHSAHIFFLFRSRGFLLLKILPNIVLWLAAYAAHSGAVSRNSLKIHNVRRRCVPDENNTIIIWESCDLNICQLKL